MISTRYVVTGCLALITMIDSVTVRAEDSPAPSIKKIKGLGREGLGNAQAAAAWKSWFARDRRLTGSVGRAR